ncbi:hypothetical protein OH77DRAFT_1417121 [Trametes cingulata]|nr:hypothetical protein OH77DRAFT_1417121 [Trametes cingulata]
MSSAPQPLAPSCLSGTSHASDRQLSTPVPLSGAAMLSGLSTEPPALLQPPERTRHPSDVTGVPAQSTLYSAASRGAVSSPWHGSSVLPTPAISTGPLPSSVTSPPPVVQYREAVLPLFVTPSSEPWPHKRSQNDMSGFRGSSGQAGVGAADPHAPSVKRPRTAAYRPDDNPSRTVFPPVSSIMSAQPDHALSPHHAPYPPNTPMPGSSSLPHASQQYFEMTPGSESNSGFHRAATNAVAGYAHRSGAPSSHFNAAAAHLNPIVDPLAEATYISQYTPNSTHIPAMHLDSSQASQPTHDFTTSPNSWPAAQAHYSQQEPHQWPSTAFQTPPQQNTEVSYTHWGTQNTSAGRRTPPSRLMPVRDWEHVQERDDFGGRGGVHFVTGNLYR